MPGVRCAHAPQVYLQFFASIICDRSDVLRHSFAIADICCSEPRNRTLTSMKTLFLHDARASFNRGTGPATQFSGVAVR